MKKIILVIVLFIFCINVKAEVCSTEEINRLKELASNVEIIPSLVVDDSRYSEEEKNYEMLSAYYDIKISNLHDYLMVFYNGNAGRQVINSENAENFIFYGGDRATFNVYSYTENDCTNKSLRTITIKFDYYNVYYYSHKDKCDEYPNFEYCKEYMNIGDKSYSEIDNLFEEYIKENTKNSGYNDRDFYYVAGGIVIVLIISILVTIIVKRYKKNKL